MKNQQLNTLIDEFDQRYTLVYGCNIEKIKQCCYNADQAIKDFENIVDEVEEKPFCVYLHELIEKKRIQHDMQNQGKNPKAPNKFEKLPNIYKAAGLSKSAFSKIANFAKPTKPFKQTVGALVIGMELNITEAEALFNAAGYSIKNPTRWNKLMEFCIDKKIYDIMVVNELFYHYQENCLGSSTR